MASQLKDKRCPKRLSMNGSRLYKNMLCSKVMAQSTTPPPHMTNTEKTTTYRENNCLSYSDCNGKICFF